LPELLPAQAGPAPETASSAASAWALVALEAGQAALAAGRPAEAVRWFDRAHRLAPGEPIAVFLRATALLQLRDPAALPLLRDLAALHDVREVWAALATAARQAGDAGLAETAMASALGRHTLLPALGPAASAVAEMAGWPGWCGVSANGTLHVGLDHPGKLEIRLDGCSIPVRLRGGVQPLPHGWQSVRQLTVGHSGQELLGSPIDIAALRHVEGCVWARAGALEGWAWHPRDPDTDPVLTLRDANGRKRAITLSQPDTGLRHPRLLARPRRLELATALAGLVPPIAVLGPDGRDLPGSPVDPWIEQRAAQALARGFATEYGLHPGRLWPPLPPAVPIRAGSGQARERRRSGRARPVLVVAAAGVDAGSLDAIRSCLPSGIRVVIAESGPFGDSQAVNSVLRANARHDVVLLQPGFVPFGDWFDHLQQAAYAAASIGTAVPFSTSSGPLRLGSPLAGGRRTCIASLAKLARAANGAETAGIAAAGGPCAYIRGDCLAETGLLRHEIFPRLPAALTDFCLRARHFGWTHVVATGVVIGAAEVPRDPVRDCLAESDAAMLDRLHPGREALAAAAILTPFRRRIDQARWKGGRARAGSVILVTHAEGGGVERLVRSRCAAIRAEGKRPVVLRPAAGGCSMDDGSDSFPDLRFAMPDELPALLRLLKAERPQHIELHHMLGHRAVIAELPRLLGLPADVFVHDYAAFCPRIALVGPERRYCGEPDLAQCAICVADAGSNLEEEIGVAELRARSAAQLRAARQVIAPSRDAARRIQRHFPGIRPVVTPWEDDAALPPARPPRAIRRVAVIGAIGVEKGYEVLLACARDAAARDLPLEFVVVGHTIDDAKLIGTGRVFVTGAYVESEAVELIRAQDADIAFIPSIWPETWCYTLSHAWRAGLDAAAFDIGAQAERIRDTGRGWLLPLGLQAAAVNNAFVTGARLVSNQTSSHHPVRSHAGRGLSRAETNRSKSN
jgi:glycosyltransferase involved in cell wall biosynthesis